MGEGLLGAILWGSLALALVSVVGIALGGATTEVMVKSGRAPTPMGTGDALRSLSGKRSVPLSG